MTKIIKQKYIYDIKSYLTNLGGYKNVKKYFVKSRKSNKNS